MNFGLLSGFVNNEYNDYEQYRNADEYIRPSGGAVAREGHYRRGQKVIQQIQHISVSFEIYRFYFYVNAIHLNRLIP